MAGSSTGGRGDIIRFFFTGDSTSAVRAMREVGDTAYSTARKVTVADEEMASANDALSVSSSKLHGMIGMLGGKVGGFLALGFGIEQSIKAASTFQQEMLTLQTQTGASAREVRFATAGVMNLATQVGIGPSGLARGLYHLESAGIRGQKALNLLRVAAEGAQIGHANLEDVTNALNAAIVSHIKGVHSYAQAMGALNATVGAGDMRMQDLADAMGHGTLAIAKNFGLSIIDVGAALATFGDNNIRGSQAATMLRMGLSRMLPVSTTAVKAFAAIGLGQTQLAEDMRKPHGLLVALRDLRAHMLGHGLTGANATLQMQQMFGGSRTSAGILTLYNQIGRLHTKYGQVTDGAHHFADAWKTFSHSLAFYISQFKAFGEVLLIKVGKVLSWLAVPIKAVIGLLGGFKGTATALLLVLGGFAAYYTTMKLITIWTKLAGLAQLAFATYTAYASLGMGGLTGAWAAFNAVVETNPIVFAIMAIVVVLYLVITHFKLVKKVVLDVFKFIAGIVMTVVNWIKAHWKLLLEILTFPFTGFLLFVIFHFNAIVRFLGGLVSGIVAIGKKMWEGLKYGLITVINWISDKINKFLIAPLNDVITVGGLLDFGQSIPNIPMISGGAQSTGSSHKRAGGPGASSTTSTKAPYAPQRSSASTMPRPAPRSGGAAQPVTIHTHVHMDSRQVAESVTRYTLQKHAAS